MMITQLLASLSPQKSQNWAKIQVFVVFLFFLFFFVFFLFFFVFFCFFVFVFVVFSRGFLFVFWFFFCFFSVFFLFFPSACFFGARMGAAEGKTGTNEATTHESNGGPKAETSKRGRQSNNRRRRSTNTNNGTTGSTAREQRGDREPQPGGTENHRKHGTKEKQREATEIAGALTG